MTLGLVCTGLSSGASLLLNLRNETQAPIKLRPKQLRPCNAVSFSSNGHLAIGLGKVRNDSCLQIWNIERVSQGDKETLKSPTYNFLPSDAISSLAFFRETPNSLLCGSYKFLREFDLRSQSSSMQLATKCVQGICVNPLNQHYYSSHADDGIVSFWDRRLMRSGEPLLSLNPLGDASRGNNGFPCFRLSSTRQGEFALLQDGDTIKRWQTGYVPNHHEPVEVSNRPDRFNQFDTYSRQPYALKPEYLFVSSVTQTTTDLDRVVSFDYVQDISKSFSLNFICVKQSGQVFRMNVVESASAMKFDPLNCIAVVDPEHITFMVPASDKTASRIQDLSADLLPRRALVLAQQSSETCDEDEESVHEGYDMDYSELLGQDISTTIRNLALSGYGMDCETNISLLTSCNNHPKGDYLRYAWR